MTFLYCITDQKRLVLVSIAFADKETAATNIIMKRVLKTIITKILWLSQPKLNVILSLKGMKISSIGPDNMAKMVAKHTHIWYKPLKLLLPRTKRHITLKPGMKHWGLRPIIVCLNNNSMLTVTNF